MQSVRPLFFFGHRPPRSASRAVAGRGGRHFTDPEDLKMPDRMLQFFGFDHLPDNLKSSRGRSASWRMTSSRSFR